MELWGQSILLKPSCFPLLGKQAPTIRISGWRSGDNLFSETFFFLCLLRLPRLGLGLGFGALEFVKKEEITNLQALLGVGVGELICRGGGVAMAGKVIDFLQLGADHGPVEELEKSVAVGFLPSLALAATQVPPLTAPLLSSLVSRPQTPRALLYASLDYGEIALAVEQAEGAGDFCLREEESSYHPLAGETSEKQWEWTEDEDNEIAGMDECDAFQQGDEACTIISPCTVTFLQQLRLLLPSFLENCARIVHAHKLRFSCCFRSSVRN